MGRASRVGSVAFVTAVAAICAWWFARREAPARRSELGASLTEPASPAQPAAQLPPRQPSPSPKGSAQDTGEPPAVAGFDRAKRDAMRGLIWRAFGREPPVTTQAAPQRRYVLPRTPPPDPPGDAGSIDPNYIQQHVRSEFFGPAGQCYDDAMKRLPDAYGTVVFWFTIVGDEKVGGIVESVDVLDESTLRDPEMIECMRESFLSVTFPPPKGGGFVTVKYPVTFAPEDEE